MSKRRQEPKRQPVGYAGALAPIAERLRPLLLPATVALLVAPHLIPSEAVAEGTHALPGMLWCLLLLGWGVVSALSADAKLRLDWSDAALLALVVLHAISGLVPRDGVVTRPALSTVWLWICYGIGWFLLRQLLSSSAQTRAVLAVMLALAIALTSQAYYQYFVSGPAIRREYFTNPERVLRENGIPLAADSTLRKHFEDRVGAVEPLATFALTNSLAGFLAPWAVLSLGLALAAWRGGRGWHIGLTLLLVAVGLLSCLLLTKSRTAVLAALAGGALLGLFGPATRSRFDWRWPAALAALLLVLGLIATIVGGLDAQVLSEAPKSVLYRLEYWRATAAMIADYPLLGVGPGNFQDYYPRYKLPQASETIADPHNLFLEIWATAGTPALLALLAWMGLLTIELGMSRGGAPGQSDAASDGNTGAQPTGPILFGGLSGVALGFGLAFLTVFPLWSQASSGHIGILLIGLPLAAIVLAMIKPWLESGPLTTSPIVIALMTLILNLCAAGAAGFPGVFTSAIVLAACAKGAAPTARQALTLSRAHRPALVILPLALAAACLWTEYTPVLQSQAAHYEGDAALAAGGSRPGNLAVAIDRWNAATQHDPHSSEPWQRLAAAHLQDWQATGSESAWDQFVQAEGELARLRPARSKQHSQRGDWYLQAYRHAGEKEHLGAALQAYEQAVTHFPNSALAHAQLAWGLHLAGRDDEARREADKALALDALMPHEEFSLRKNRLTDPVQDAAAGGWRIQRLETAEQTLQRLRTKQVTGGQEEPSAK